MTTKKRHKLNKPLGSSLQFALANFPGDDVIDDMSLRCCCSQFPKFGRKTANLPTLPVSKLLLLVVSGKGNRGSCRRDIMRDIDIFGVTRTRYKLWRVIRDGTNIHSHNRHRHLSLNYVHVTIRTRLTIRLVLGGTVPLFSILSRRPDRSAKRPALAFSQPA